MLELDFLLLFDIFLVLVICRRCLWWWW